MQCGYKNLTWVGQVAYNAWRKQQEDMGSLMMSLHAPIAPVELPVFKKSGHGNSNNVSFSAYMREVSGTLANGKICIKRSTNPEAGLGLFAAQDIARGQIITEYCGDIISRKAIGTIPRTHMLRIKETDLIINGRPIAFNIMRDMPDKNGCYAFYSPSNHHIGLGALANSSKEGKNCEIIFLKDWDLPNAVRALMPNQVFLRAAQEIKAGDEIMWDYYYYQGSQVKANEGDGTGAMAIERRNRTPIPHGAIVEMMQSHESCASVGYAASPTDAPTDSPSQSMLDNAAGSLTEGL